MRKNRPAELAAAEDDIQRIHVTSYTKLECIRQDRLYFELASILECCLIKLTLRLAKPVQKDNEVNN